MSLDRDLHFDVFSNLWQFLTPTARAALAQTSTTMRNVERTEGKRNESKWYKPIEVTNYFNSYNEFAQNSLVKTLQIPENMPSTDVEDIGDAAIQLTFRGSAYVEKNQDVNTSNPNTIVNSRFFPDGVVTAEVSYYTIRQTVLPDENGDAILEGVEHKIKQTFTIPFVNHRISGYMTRSIVTFILDNDNDEEGEIEVSQIDWYANLYNAGIPLGYMISIHQNNILILDAKDSSNQDSYVGILPELEGNNFLSELYALFPNLEKPKEEDINDLIARSSFNRAVSWRKYNYGAEEEGLHDTYVMIFSPIEQNTNGNAWVLKQIQYSENDGQAQILNLDDFLGKEDELGFFETINDYDFYFRINMEGKVFLTGIMPPDQLTE